MSLLLITAELAQCVCNFRTQATDKNLNEFGGSEISGCEFSWHPPKRLSIGIREVNIYSFQVRII